ncbi:hypothetical protein CEK71_19800 [Methylovulum psychrotolerans]|uniref:Transposase IS66 central domain-containing protein n=1 Tax=Methylovulum psychrotolerans TaxID=1704499 RepID=A0A1Z4C3K7_9GAMM|nr:hypothetical protein CEK71_19800 [Methylovulum psychrotolerans]
MIVFDYQKGRGGEHTRQFLGAWKGHLMVDGYAGYKALFTDTGACTELACFVPMRGESSSTCTKPTNTLRGTRAPWHGKYYNASVCFMPSKPKAKPWALRHANNCGRKKASPNCVPSMTGS